MSYKIYLIDIDGTVCDDIKNEDSHEFPNAIAYPDAKERINELYENGNQIVFFTARESKDREVTETWLKENGFKYHGLLMDKPRFENASEYVWIDNQNTRGVKMYKYGWKDIEILMEIAQ